MDLTIPNQLRQIALAADIPLASSSPSATTRLVLTDSRNLPSDFYPITWIYAFVAPFPTLTEGVGTDDIRLAWGGNPAPALAGSQLWMDESTLAVFTALWGEPGLDAVNTAPADILRETLWSSQKPGFAIIPFENLEPRWKVLTVGGQSPIHKEFEPSAYPLTVTFACVGKDCSNLNLPGSNRDSSKLTVVVMTGVTALVRGTAWTMEQKGILYPGRDIRDWLRKADITHISNEIPFAQNCPYPDPNQEAIAFCSDPRYIELLEDVGADVIEMTGNHFQDWGSSAAYNTIDMYRQRGLLYYGGGSDLADSQKPVEIESNGNRIAFIGCNASGPDYAWATPSQPGAAPCGDFTWMVNEIARLRSEGFLPIVTFQYYEYYTPEPRPNQVHDFELVADAGAIIVSGSQAHVPQAMEFYNGTFILYGLGNLFFDQMFYQIGNVMSTDTRQELIARHVFYDNKYINTELLTAMLEDRSRPRPMTGQERVELLNKLFSVSGWK
jgi:poly-gamma-glutamate synthesis protein (capsule biosynthesis protein)